MLNWTFLIISLLLFDSVFSNKVPCLPDGDMSNGLKARFFPGKLNNLKALTSPDFLAHDYLQTAPIGEIEGITNPNFDIRPCYIDSRRRTCPLDSNYVLLGFNHYICDLHYCQNSAKGLVSNVNVLGLSTTVTNFTLELTGYIKVDVTGAYKFVINAADDVAGIAIGGGSAFDCCDSGLSKGVADPFFDANGVKDWDYSPSPISADIYLHAGVYYPVRLMYANIYNYAHLETAIIFPNGDKIKDWGSLIYNFENGKTADTASCTLPPLGIPSSVNVLPDPTSILGPNIDKQIEVSGTITATIKKTEITTDSNGQSSVVIEVKKALVTVAPSADIALITPSTVIVLQSVATGTSSSKSIQSTSSIGTTSNSVSTSVSSSSSYVIPGDNIITQSSSLTDSYTTDTPSSKSSPFSISTSSSTTVYNFSSLPIESGSMSIVKSDSHTTYSVQKSPLATRIEATSQYEESDGKPQLYPRTSAVSSIAIESSSFAPTDLTFSRTQVSQTGVSNTNTNVLSSDDEISHMSSTTSSSNESSNIISTTRMYSSNSQIVSASNYISESSTDVTHRSSQSVVSQLESASTISDSYEQSRSKSWELLPSSSQSETTITTGISVMGSTGATNFVDPINSEGSSGFTSSTVQTDPATLTDAINLPNSENLRYSTDLPNSSTSSIFEMSIFAGLTHSIESTSSIDFVSSLSSTSFIETTSPSSLLGITSAPSLITSTNLPSSMSSISAEDSERLAKSIYSASPSVISNSTRSMDFITSKYPRSETDITEATGNTADLGGSLESQSLLCSTCSLGSMQFISRKASVDPIDLRRSSRILSFSDSTKQTSFTSSIISTEARTPVTTAKPMNSNDDTKSPTIINSMPFTMLIKLTGSESYTTITRPTTFPDSETSTDRSVQRTLLITMPSILSDEFTKSTIIVNVQDGIDSLSDFYNTSSGPSSKSTTTISPTRSATSSTNYPYYSQFPSNIESTLDYLSQSTSRNSYGDASVNAVEISSFPMSTPTAKSKGGSMTMENEMSSYGSDPEYRENSEIEYTASAIWRTGKTKSDVDITNSSTRNLSTMDALDDHFTSLHESTVRSSPQISQGDISPLTVTYTFESKSEFDPNPTFDTQSIEPSGILLDAIPFSSSMREDYTTLVNKYSTSSDVTTSLLSKDYNQNTPTQMSASVSIIAESTSLSQRDIIHSEPSTPDAPQGSIISSNVFENNSDGMAPARFGLRMKSSFSNIQSRNSFMSDDPDYSSNQSTVTLNDYAIKSSESTVHPTSIIDESSKATRVNLHVSQTPRSFVTVLKETSSNPSDTQNSDIDAVGRIDDFSSEIYNSIENSLSLSTHPSSHSDLKSSMTAFVISSTAVLPSNNIRTLISSSMQKFPGSSAHSTHSNNTALHGDILDSDQSSPLKTLNDDIYRTTHTVIDQNVPQSTENTSSRVPNMVPDTGESITRSPRTMDNNSWKIPLPSVDVYRESNTNITDNYSGGYSTIPATPTIPSETQSTSHVLSSRSGHSASSTEGSAFEGGCPSSLNRARVGLAILILYAVL
ncbi:hypothetical protein DAKH74_009780 [Maudiozyma humilis]|uniref:PA14 domain-containing protein n=1 Tax=Maudiozyma humilis TaxID=51915 RepID=A0AAV5RSU1_MAUHU|nr:hypothetical protein DAKH74_009780 [Kazachstania humilis]